MGQAFVIQQRNFLQTRDRKIMDKTPAEELRTLTDDELIALVKQGRDEAFTHLVQRYQHKVYSLVYRVMQIPEETEDMAQDVFVTIYRTLHQFRHDCSFSTWIYRIAINLCKNRLKYLQRRNFHRAQDIAETSEKNIQSPHPLAFADPEQQLMGRELEKIVQRELAGLEEDFRIVLVLRDLEHLSYEDIVDITGLALGTVKSRIHRARTTLKKRMEPYLQ